MSLSFEIPRLMFEIHEPSCPINTERDREDCEGSVYLSASARAHFLPHLIHATWLYLAGIGADRKEEAKDFPTLDTDAEVARSRPMCYHRARTARN